MRTELPVRRLRVRRQLQLRRRVHLQGVTGPAVSGGPELWPACSMKQ
jgi:hypothetical protein